MAAPADKACGGAFADAVNWSPAFLCSAILLAVLSQATTVIQSEASFEGSSTARRPLDYGTIVR